MVVKKKKIVRKISKPVKAETPTGKLNKTEQETIISFNRGDLNANLFTYQKSLQNHMKKLGAQVINTNTFGGMDFSFPKNWVRFPLVPRNERSNKEEDV